MKKTELDEKELAELVELAKIASEKAKVMCEELAAMAIKYESKRRAKLTVNKTNPLA